MADGLVKRAMKGMRAREYGNEERGLREARKAMRQSAGKSDKGSSSRSHPSSRKEQRDNRSESDTRHRSGDYSEHKGRSGERAFGRPMRKK